MTQSVWFLFYWTKGHSYLCLRMLRTVECQSQVPIISLKREARRGPERASLLHCPREMKQKMYVEAHSFTPCII